MGIFSRLTVITCFRTYDEIKYLTSKKRLCYLYNNTIPKFKIEKVFVSCWCENKTGKLMYLISRKKTESFPVFTCTMVTDVSRIFYAESGSTIISWFGAKISCLMIVKFSIPATHGHRSPETWFLNLLEVLTKHTLFKGSVVCLTCS